MNTRRFITGNSLHNQGIKSFYEKNFKDLSRKSREISSSHKKLQEMMSHPFDDEGVYDTEKDAVLAACQYDEESDSVRILDYTLTSIDDALDVDICLDVLPDTEDNWDRIPDVKNIPNDWAQKDPALKEKMKELGTFTVCIMSKIKDPQITSDLGESRSFSQAYLHESIAYLVESRDHSSEENTIQGWFDFSQKFLNPSQRTLIKASIEAIKNSKIRSLVEKKSFSRQGYNRFMHIILEGASPKRSRPGNPRLGESRVARFHHLKEWGAVNIDPNRNNKGLTLVYPVTVDVPVSVTSSNILGIKKNLDASQGQDAVNKISRNDTAQNQLIKAAAKALKQELKSGESQISRDMGDPKVQQGIDKNQTYFAKFNFKGDLKQGASRSSGEEYEDYSNDQLIRAIKNAREEGDEDLEADLRAELKSRLSNQKDTLQKTGTKLSSLLKVDDPAKLKNAPQETKDAINKMQKMDVSVGKNGKLYFRDPENGKFISSEDAQKIFQNAGISVKQNVR